MADDDIESYWDGIRPKKPVGAPGKPGLTKAGERYEDQQAGPPPWHPDYRRLRSPAEAVLLPDPAIGDDCLEETVAFLIRNFCDDIDRQALRNALGNGGGNVVLFSDVVSSLNSEVAGLQDTLNRWYRTTFSRRESIPQSILDALAPIHGDDEEVIPFDELDEEVRRRRRDNPDLINRIFSDPTNPRETPSRGLPGIQGDWARWAREAGLDASIHPTDDEGRMLPRSDESPHQFIDRVTAIRGRASPNARQTLANNAIQNLTNALAALGFPPISITIEAPANSGSSLTLHMSPDIEFETDSDPDEISVTFSHHT